MNFPTIIVLALLAVWLYFALRRSIALGRSGGCASCGGACSCSSHKPDADAKQTKPACSGTCASCKAACNCQQKS